MNFLKSSKIIITPATGTGWEIWRQGNPCVWQGSSLDPGTAVPGKACIVALPARSCRTFAFSAPTEDVQLIRKLAFAQLEKRGLTTAGAAQTPYDCHVLEQGGGRSIVSVEMLHADAAASLGTWNASAALPAARLFPFPADRLVLMEEQGRLVLCAGSGGRLLHSQIVSASPEITPQIAQEIRIAMLALQQSGVLRDVTGLELWGDFTAEDGRMLAAQSGMPATVSARPAPDAACIRRESGTRLLPAASRQQQSRRRLGILRWAAAAAIIGIPAWWASGKYQSLTNLEAEAARIESTLEVPGSTGDATDQAEVRADVDLVKRTQTRWAALRSALDPRRYPVAHLDGLTRCLASGDVVLTKFETKVHELSVSGTGRTAKEAYSYFNAVSADGPLGVYAWSMGQPMIGPDGAASFELKGKLR